MSTKSELLSEVAADEALLEIGRKAIEDVLIIRRDARGSMLGCGNGLVIRERSGKDSHIIRMTTADALAIALTAIAENLRGPS